MANIKLPEHIEPGQPVEVQLAPRGKFPQIVNGEEVEQILDDDSIKSLVSTFDEKVLVDADHESETGKGTKAEAWVTKVWDDPERGLMGSFEFTDIGADDVNNKRYRFISPAWTLGDDGRPVKLMSVGMTNKPNLPVAPVLNCAVACIVNSIEAPGVGGSAPVMTENDGAIADAPPTGGEESATPKNDSSNESEGNPEMDEFIKAIKAKLTLPEDATIEDVTGAIDALVARCGTCDAVNSALGLEPGAANEETITALDAVLADCGQLQTQNEEMLETQRNAEADAFVAENEDVIPEESTEEIREEYKANPEVAQRTVENMRKAVAKAVLNSRMELKREARAALNTSEAHKPVVANSVEQGLAACGGDPVKENEFLRSLHK